MPDVPLTPPLVPGYELVQVVGGGATSTVWAGMRQFHGTRSAVKVFTQPVQTSDAAGAFLRECRTTARFASHPNVVQLETFGFLPGDRPYLATRLYERGSLQAQLAEHGRFTRARALEVAVTVAGACATAHEAGVLHNDIKPANVFVTDLDDVVLGDFGVAALADLQASGSEASGYTPAYAAPELLAGGDPTRATDVFALGALTYEMLVGRKWYSVEPGGTLQPPADPWPPDLPEPVREVLMRVLSPNPADRLSMRAFGEALRSAQGATGLTQTPLRISALAPPDLSHLDPTSVGWGGHGQQSWAAPFPTQPPMGPGPGSWPGDPRTGPGGPSAAGPGQTWQPAPARSRRGLLVGLGAGLLVLVLGGAALAVGLTSGSKATRAGVVPSPSMTVTRSASTSPTPSDTLFDDPRPTVSPLSRAQLSARITTPIGFTVDTSDAAVARARDLQYSLTQKNSDYAVVQVYLTKDGRQVILDVIHLTVPLNVVDVDAVLQGTFDGVMGADQEQVSDYEIAGTAHAARLMGSVAVASEPDAVITVYDAGGTVAEAKDVLDQESTSIERGNY